MSTLARYYERRHAEKMAACTAGLGSIFDDVRPVKAPDGSSWWCNYSTNPPTCMPRDKIGAGAPGSSINVFNQPTMPNYAQYIPAPPGYYWALSDAPNSNPDSVNATTWTSPPMAADSPGGPVSYVAGLSGPLIIVRVGMHTRILYQPLPVGSAPPPSGGLPAPHGPVRSAATHGVGKTVGNDYDPLDNFVLPANWVSFGHVTLNSWTIPGKGAPRPDGSGGEMTAWSNDGSVWLIDNRGSPTAAQRQTMMSTNNTQAMMAADRAIYAAMQWAFKWDPQYASILRSGASLSFPATGEMFGPPPRNLSPHAMLRYGRCVVDTCTVIATSVSASLAGRTPTCQSGNVKTRPSHAGSGGSYGSAAGKCHQKAASAAQAVIRATTCAMASASPAPRRRRTAARSAPD